MNQTNQPSEENKNKSSEEKDNPLTKSKEEKKETKGKKEKKEKKRYKIAVGNGCHKAICDVQGMLVPNAQEEGNFVMILPDGLQVDARFKTKYLHVLAMKHPERIQGMHWFRCYPKLANDRLVCLQIIAWDGDIAENKNGKEYWEFIGAWTAQRNITVQRSMAIKEVRQIARETGFIKKFKYTFTNSFDFKRSLWMGYVYKIIGQRDGDQLKIRKVVPFACPRFKPKPPEKNFKSRKKRDEGRGTKDEGKTV